MVLAANATAQRCRTSTQLTLGKRYRCTYTATSTAGAPAFAYHNSGTEYALTATVGSSTITNGTANSFEFVMPAAISTKYFYILATTASDGVTLDDVSVVEVGAVADFDLAFANPTQSTIVQNRSGSGDGTAAGGVSQISPIEAVNTNKLNVSGTTPLVGIGLAAGVTPSEPLEVVDTVKIQNAGTSNLIIDNTYSGGGESGQEWLLMNANSGSDSTLQIKAGISGGAASSGKLVMLMSATGNVGLGVVPAATVADYTALEIGGLTNISAKTGAGVAGNPTVISNNAFIDTNNFNNGWKRLIEDECSQHLLVDGTHKLRVAGSAATSAAITWTDALTISSAGLASFSAGINLGNVASATATTLDGYEEGVHQTTVTCSTSGTVTLNTSYDELGYTRIGRMVFVTGYLLVTSVSSPVGYMKISLPFSSADASQSRASGVVTIHNTVSANISDFVQEIHQNVAFMRVYLGDATGVQSDSAEQMQATTNIRVSCFYYTDDAF